MTSKRRENINLLSFICLSFLDTFYTGSSPLKAKCVRYILPRFDTFHTYSIHFQTWNALNVISFQEKQQPSCKCKCGVTFVSCTCVSIST